MTEEARPGDSGTLETSGQETTPPEAQEFRLNSSPDDNGMPVGKIHHPDDHLHGSANHWHPMKEAKWYMKDTAPSHPWDSDPFYPALGVPYPGMMDPGVHLYPHYGIKPMLVPHGAVHPDMTDLLKECLTVCEQHISTLLCRPDVQLRARQIQYLRDCTDILALALRQVARSGPMTRKMMHLCAKACAACGRECLRFLDPESQMCGRLCVKCASACRKFLAYSAH